MPAARRGAVANPRPDCPTARLVPFTFANLGALPGLRHGITRRAPALWRDGDQSYATGGDPEKVYASRRAWADAIGCNAAVVVGARQVHGARVVRVTAADRGKGARDLAGAVADCDGLITDDLDTPLLMCYADCAPLLFYDPVRRVAGLAHAGWRGTVAGIAEAMVRALTAQFGSAPTDLRVGIGPAIGACCYVVGDEVVAAWHALGVQDDAVATEIAPVNGRRQWRFDLPRANRLLLERAGVAPAHIEDAAHCTACHVAEFPSHRAERGQAGRFAALICLTANEGAL
ncbi:MAG TPA: peptidoglycan editing factor PgeF [Thermomicrobiales bacterium]|nr:peptidoglycan editing factor PgeF [Thermomicrobiales bacterium]